MVEAKCGYPLYWFGCYRGTFDVIAPSSMAHPAKMSVALCYRILQHLQELHLLKEGDTILDPMSGTGITNICAGAMGYSSISVELEEKFIGFQKENKDYAERRLYKPLDWTMIKGDSRRLSELLKRQGLKSVVSPPYEATLDAHHGHSKADREKEIKKLQAMGYKINPNSADNKVLGAEYSDNPDNIGNLADKRLKAIVSPPYGECIGRDAEYYRKIDTENKKRALELYGSQLPSYSENPDNIGNLADKPLKSVMSPPYTERHSYADSEREQALVDKLKENPSSKIGGRRIHTHENSENPNNIGNLSDKPLKSVVSPPYEGATGHHRLTAPHRKDGSLIDDTLHRAEGYGKSEGQIENLPDKPLKSVMSPPYANRLDDYGLDKDGKQGYGYKRDSYGRSDGQIGIPVWDDGRRESYLEAMSRVYSEIALVSDVLCVVVKNPTRNGKLRRLDLDTIKVLELAGWTIHCQHRALLFEELEQGDMFQGSKKRVKGRLSFFKRLSWQNGNPVASWEDILVCVRK